VYARHLELKQASEQASKQAPQPKRESLVAVLGVGVPCLVLCHFLVHGLGFGLLLLCLPVVVVIVGCRIRFLVVRLFLIFFVRERDVYWLNFELQFVTVRSEASSKEPLGPITPNFLSSPRIFIGRTQPLPGTANAIVLRPSDYYFSQPRHTGIGTTPRGALV